MAVPPRIVTVAIHRLSFVVESVIPDDARSRRVRGANFSAPMQPSVGLIEIGGCFYVGRDAEIIPVAFGNAIDLHGEQHRNTGRAKLASQLYRRRSSPAMPINNDPSGLLFIVREP